MIFDSILFTTISHYCLWTKVFVHHEFQISTKYHMESKEELEHTGIVCLLFLHELRFFDSLTFNEVLNYLEYIEVVTYWKSNNNKYLVMVLRINVNIYFVLV